MKNSFLCLVLLFVVTACLDEKDPSFLITEDSVGKLKRNELLADLESVFASDSLVKDTLSTRIGQKAKKVKIFEKGGAHLLTLTTSADSMAKVEHVRIFDPRFTTADGIGLNSTFGELREAYPIRKLVTSRNNVVVFLKNTDLYFTISKEELPSSLRYSSSTNIEAVQIPDKAKMKYLMLGWD